MRFMVFFHVLTMFSAVALSYGSLALLWTAARGGDVDGLRGISRTVRRIARLIGPVYMLGIVLGLVAVFTGGWDPTQGWLIAAYVLTFLAIVSANVVVSPWLQRVDAELAGPTHAVPTVFSDRRLGSLLVVDAAIIIALIADMILKPF